MGGACCHGIQALQESPRGPAEGPAEVQSRDHVLPVHTGPLEGPLVGKLSPRPKRRSGRQRDFHFYPNEGHPLNQFEDSSADAAFEAFKDVWFEEFGHSSTNAEGDSSRALSDAAPSSRSDCTLMCPPKPPPSSVMMANGRPNFSGSWLCHATHGDMDAFMDSMGVDWTRRTAAAFFGYGVNVTTRMIEQHGNKLVIHARVLPGISFVQRFEIGGGEQQTDGVDGAVMLVPQWEQRHMLSVVQNNLDGSSPNIWHQYFYGEELVVKVIAPSGVGGAFRFGRIIQ